MLLAYLTGFSLGFSLILAIGAQNAFVLRQGLRRSHVLLVVLTCALSDATLIILGVAGFGWLANTAPWIAPTLRWLGVAFLLTYGALAFRDAVQSKDALQAAENKKQSWQSAMVTCLAITWLNPHVYLDTVVLIGSVASRWPGQGLAFGTGAVSASFAFFFALGYGARLLAPAFARPGAWRALNVFVGIIMWSIALSLILRG